LGDGSLSIFVNSMAMFIETNPLPIKTAMAKMGMIQKEWRLPLGEMNKENEEIVIEALYKYGLL